MHGCSPTYILYGVVSGECSCRTYCTTTGIHRWFCSEATPSPSSPMAFDFEDDDDDDASDDADGDASSSNEMST